MTIVGQMTKLPPDAQLWRYLSLATFIDTRSSRLRPPSRTARSIRHPHSRPQISFGGKAFFLLEKWNADGVWDLKAVFPTEHVGGITDGTLEKLWRITEESIVTEPPASVIPSAN